MHTHACMHAHTHTVISFVLFFQSRYKEEGKKESCMSLYSVLPETPETRHAREASELQSQVPRSRFLEENSRNVLLENCIDV